MHRPLLSAALLAAICFAPSLAHADVLVAPKVKSEITPEFPASESQDAEVVVELVIDASGHVTDAKIKTSAGDAFDASALAAAKELVFEPATRDGNPIPARIHFSFRFKAPDVVAPAPSVSPSPAPTPAPEPAPAPIEAPVVEVEVVGEAPPREVTHHSLSGEAMRKMPGTNGDPLRAVEAMPGVGKPPGMSGILIVRGGAPEDTSIFIDGIWVPYAYHFGGVSSVIPGDVLEKIDFYPGNFGPQYGRAIGGVVELGIRSPRKDRFGGLLQIDLLDGRAMIEGPLSDKTRVLVAARRSWVDAWLGPVLRSGGTGVVTAPVYQDAQLVIEHDLTDHTTVRLAAFGSDDRLALLLESPQASDPTAGGSLSSRQGFARFQLQSRTRLPGGTWTNMISWGPNWERFSLGDIKAANDFRMMHARSDLRFAISEGAHGVVGLDLLNLWGDVTLKIPPQPAAGSVEDSPIFGRPLRDLHVRGSFWWPGAYAMLDLQPGAGIRLLPGVRADYSENSGRWTIDPRIAMRWTVARGTTLKGGVGLYHQPPQPSESIAPFGTPDLKNPTALHTSIGVEQDLGSGFELSVEGFHKQLRDLVIAHAAEATTASGTTYDNSGSGRAYGLEVLAKGRHGRFTGWIAYTLSRSERRDAPGEPLRIFKYDQTHVLSMLASYDLGRGWTLGGHFRYVTGLPYTPYVGGLVDLDAGAYTPVAGARDSARVAAFHALDVRLEKQWTFTDWKLAAYLDVRNVYNRKDSEGTVYRYDYAESQPASGIPILPIIGVRGEL
ncbi:MAG: TonB-dependent receptor domain-containing protein [Polyangiales bacterium]